MTNRNIIRMIAAFCLMTGSPLAIQAQVMLPAPGKDIATLVSVLESESPVYEKAKACQQLAIIGDAEAVPALAKLLLDERLSTYARSALENIQAAKAGEALRTACKSLEGAQLAGVIQSLGKRKDAQATLLLAKFVDAGEPVVHVAAARALANLGTADAADLLRRAVASKSGASQLEIARACLICAQRLVAEGDHQKADSLCQGLLDANLPQEIHLAANYQRIIAKGRNGGILLMRLFASDDPKQFETALYASRRLDTDLIPLTELASMIETQSPQRQVLLMNLLSDVGDARVLPSIRIAARSSQTKVRIAAIHALVKLNDENRLPILLEGVATAEKPVVDAAVQSAIALRGQEVDEVAVKLLESDQSQTVLAAIEIVAGRRTSRAFPQLKRLLGHQDQEVCQRAVYALGQIADDKSLADLVALMVAGNDDKLFSDLQQAVKSACLRMPQEDCARTLASAMKGAPEQSRIKLLEQLAWVGGPKALETVVNAAKSNDDAMQDAATRVLGEWLTADAAPEIFELVKTLPKGKYKTRMLRGYIRIGRQLNMTTQQRMEVCRNALAIADRKEEKVLVLAVLRRNPTPEGLAMATTLGEKDGINSARTTVQAIAEILDAEVADETGFVPLFDGKSLNGWKGGDLSFWRVENDAIVGGDLEKKVKQNEFLRTTKEYSNFELRLQFKLTGEKTNAGVQFRTAEIPDHHEVSGYQADLGDGWWGCLYDESRRRKVLAGPPGDQRAKHVRLGEWNDYRIRCEGTRIQIWMNGVRTVDYTETDPEIPQTGVIALQVHGNLIMEARYRNIRIKTMAN